LARAVTIHSEGSDAYGTI